MDLPARRRVLAVEPAFAPALSELQRGWVVGCTGASSMSIAMALIAKPMVAGAWAVVIEAPMFGLEAAAELGIPLHRLVGVDGGAAGDWADRIVASAAGFEMIVTCPPPGAERHVRRVQHRLRSAGSVMFVVTPGPSTVPCDVNVDTVSVTWDGLGIGHGHLRARRVLVRIDGRRVPRPVEHEMWLPTDDGRVVAVDPVHVETLAERAG